MTIAAIDFFDKAVVADVHQRYLDYTAQLTAQQESFAATTGNGLCLIRPELTQESDGQNYWYQITYDGNYHYMVTATPPTLANPVPDWITLDRKGYMEYNAWDLERKTPGPYGWPAKTTYADGNGTITGYVYRPGDENQRIYYQWQGKDGASSMITREAVSDYFSARGIKTAKDLSWYMPGIIKEDVYGEAMAAIRAGDYEVNPDQVERHVQQAVERQRVQAIQAPVKKTVGETVLDNLFEVINNGEKLCLGTQLRPATVDSTVYYMNGQNGTEFDYHTNRHLPPFMVFHKNGSGYMKVFFNKDDTVDVYLYPKGEQRPAQTAHADLAEGTTAMLGGLLLKQADDQKVWDSALKKIDFKVKSIQPLDANPADNILPFAARS